MDSFARWIKNDEVRFFFDFIDHLQHVSGEETAVGKAVCLCVLFCSCNSFFHDFHTDHFFCDRCKDLGDGSGSAVEVEDRAVFRLADELAGGAVENFRAKGIGLEEGERGDLEFQSEEFFIEVVLSVEHFCLIALYNICQGIIYDMEESDNLSFQRQTKHFLHERHQIPLFLACGDEIYQDFSGILGSSHQQVAQVTLVAYLVVVTCVPLFKVRQHAEDGVDFVTLHCGITRKTIEQIRKHKRKMNIVSRGGSLVFAWMSMTGNENPFYEHFDEILDICEEHDVTISLGDACRPGCLADATDVCQIEELVRLGELTKRAWAHNVQVMVEGPGHVPLNQVAANMEIQKTICMGAPFYVLGPIVTDIAPGYDHITSAIGGAIAASAGAAFLCYVTPAEHLALPNVEDVKQGIIAARIAAHAADIAKKVPHARDLDDAMADARRTFDWEKQWEYSIDPETARAIRESRAPEHEDSCSMCGKFCAVRSMNKALSGEYIDIL